MSLYECSNHHIMPSGAIRCQECGAYLAYEDGYSESEMRSQEEWEDKQEEDDEG